jgi:hypothetical protein
MTIGEIYKLTDAHPPAFGEVTSITQNEIWDHDLEVDEEVELAWADWYQWNEKDVYCIQGGGFEIERLIPATADEVAIYRQKVEEYKAYWEDEG